MWSWRRLTEEQERIASSSGAASTRRRGQRLRASVAFVAGALARPDACYHPPPCLIRTSLPPLAASGQSRMGPHVAAAVAALRAGAFGNTPRAYGGRACSSAVRVPAARTSRCRRSAANLEVPEDRNKPDGRKIRLFVAVLPANTLSPEERPAVHPRRRTRARRRRTSAPFAARLNERAQATRDIVPGRSARHRPRRRPDLRRVQARRTRHRRRARNRPRPAREGLCGGARAQGVDAAQYTTTAWIADLEAVRDALGYARWNLWGGSPTARASRMEYLRRHPGPHSHRDPRRVAPPDIDDQHARTSGAHGRPRFDAVLARAAASPACREAPSRSRRRRWRDREDRWAAGRELAFVDPRTGDVRRDCI